LKIESVNKGTLKPISAKSGKTGIYKLSQLSDVFVTKLGLANDEIGDLTHHGGVDQAVYLYTRPDLEWWSSELKTNLQPGTFGENILISEMTSAELCLGDRFLCGEVTLEVTSYRMPCATLAARMNDKFFVKRFNQAMKHGAYCRVISGGAICSGLEMHHQPYDGDKVTLAEMATAHPIKKSDQEFVKRVLSTPAHWKTLRDLR
jgi:MOSC domain-containing protein YiiM